MGSIDIALSRTIAATPDQVFDVWLDPKSPGSPWFGAERTILQPTVDGLFYHAVRHEGHHWPHYGRFIRLDRPRVIEHTWVSEATKGVETLLTLTFEARGRETAVTLHHTHVPDDPMGRQHEEGWKYVLEAIAARFASPRS
jgi:uncharacterized protein YndB with AHSA1/START domain